MSKDWIKVNENDLLKHQNLDQGDQIYHLQYYESRGTYQESPGNDLIINLKKPVDRKGSAEWAYKQAAILRIASDMVEIMNQSDRNDYRRVYWVPVPPSKIKTDPMFDDRVYQILVLFQNLIDAKNHFIADVIYQRENREAFSSATGNRRDIDELSASYEMNEIPNYNPDSDLIIIFDDVLTSGCHYKAVERKILNRYNNARIKGLFVARTIRKDP